jgi:hypothetical protein
LQPLVTYVLEPGKLRVPRDSTEAAFVATDDQVAEPFPAHLPRVIVSHTRPEPMIGVLRCLDNGPQRTRYLGYRNCGGTFDAVRAGGPRNRDAMILTCLDLIGFTVGGTSRGSCVVVCGTGIFGIDCLRKRGTR